MNCSKVLGDLVKVADSPPRPLCLPESQCSQQGHSVLCRDQIVREDRPLQHGVSEGDAAGQQQAEHFKYIRWPAIPAGLT